MRELLWFVAGAFTGFVLDLLAEALFPTIRLHYRRWALRIRGRRLTEVGVSPTRLSVGGLIIDWILLASARYSQGRIRCSYNDVPMPLPDEFSRMKREFVQDWKRRAALGEPHLPYNSPTYKLEAFDVGYREVIDGEEVPILRLSFRPTDYFTQLVTDFNVGNPLRDSYAKATDITVQPVPQFSTILGVNVNVVTKDGYVIVTEGSQKLPIGAGQLRPSVNENLLRPTDAGADAAPDPFRCALRGAQEELGLVLNPEEVEFTAFGVEPNLCQYSLFGWCQVNETRSEVEELRTLAIPKDKWENRNLLFVPCKPESVARFVFSNKERWLVFGLVAILLSLFQTGYTKSQVEQAFLHAQSGLPS